MLPSYRLGTVLGVPIRLNLSFLLLLGAVFFWMGGLAGLAVALLGFGSVLVHELGHALVARRLGVRVSEIELQVFGGAAKMMDQPRLPGDELLIAAAGPAVSFVLAGLGYGLALVPGLELFALLGSVNLVLGAFNLIPAFPSDGGRILRALLARRHGLIRATELAVKVSRVVLVLLAVAGLFTSFQLVLVAGVLWMMGSAERQAVRLQGEPPGWQGRAGRRAPQTVADVIYVPPPPARPGPRGRRPIVVVWR
jgi:Zn-dependent protease